MQTKNYYINDKNEFIIENYNQRKPFSSFLPAVSGILGKPMWAYYVNRGQCMATFGVNNKDYSIMEFQPANKAYRQTALQGFRTFIKITSENGDRLVYEPFRDNTNMAHVQQKMHITSYDFKIEDINTELGIKTTVMFCTLANEDLPALVRTVKVENIGKNSLELEVLDGMAVIIPYYLINADMKNESNLRQAWMSADMVDGMPFYHIKALPYDTPETVLLEGGNFYLSFSFDDDNMKISPSITDPSLIFGSSVDFENPFEFMKKDFCMPNEQVSVGYTPCAFAYKKLCLESGSSHTENVLVGSAADIESYRGFVKSITSDYMEKKIDENKRLIEGSKRHMFTSSAVKEFDLYCGQTFMDNFLRGGYPILTGNKKHTLYVYSRKHGDLEREYNFFQVNSTNYSQGNANFRDVNQNRRNDVYFFPFVKDSVIRTFFQLIQLDGFNPLVLNGAEFKPKRIDECKEVIIRYFSENELDIILPLLEPAFEPGKLLIQMEQRKIRLEKKKRAAFIDDLLEICEKEERATFQEGYWVDHWTYNNDLLEQFLQVYPDEAIGAVFESCDYTYYDNDEMVVPRNRRYVLTKNGVRQYNTVQKVKEKAEMIASREESPNTVRTKNGKGEIYKTTLAAKIISLLVNKAASLDPQGIGIEMEGNKLGWCDALNGLPGILGSSINESAELKRLADIFAELLLMSQNVQIKLPAEIYGFMNDLLSLFSKDLSDMEYWEKSNEIKEAYREKIFFGISGEEKNVSAEAVLGFVKALSGKLSKGLKNALDEKTDIYHTYYINEAVRYSVASEDDEKTFVNVLEFKSRPIPDFLEGQVHMMRVPESCPEKLHDAVKKSAIYDRELEMFKVNENIMDETKEIGRQNVFPRGWLENEAVFLHMEYKYFLELLRTGLYEEFFYYLKNSSIPFLNPEIYGRSTLENCTFIASTAHPDKRIHGSGYVSRLTGASTEFLHMWRLMTAGEKLLYINENNELCLKLDPKLPDWIFTTEEKEITLPDGETKIAQPKDSFMCTLLGSVPLLYHNPNRVSTYKDGNGITEMTITGLEGNKQKIIGDTITGELAKMVRDGRISRIDAEIGVR